MSHGHSFCLLLGEFPQVRPIKRAALAVRTVRDDSLPLTHRLNGVTASACSQPARGPPSRRRGSRCLHICHRAGRPGCIQAWSRAWSRPVVAMLKRLPRERRTRGTGTCMGRSPGPRPREPPRLSQREQGRAAQSMLSHQSHFLPYVCVEAFVFFKLCCAHNFP